MAGPWPIGDPFGVDPVRRVLAHRQIVARPGLARRSLAVAPMLGA
jgi:hypothetical protein